MDFKRFDKKNSMFSENKHNEFGNVWKIEQNKKKKTTKTIKEVIRDPKKKKKHKNIVRLSTIARYEGYPYIQRMYDKNIKKKEKH